MEASLVGDFDGSDADTDLTGGRFELEPGRAIFPGRTIPIIHGTSWSCITLIRLVRSACTSGRWQRSETADAQSDSSPVR